jgi:hypothetical protein
MIGSVSAMDLNNASENKNLDVSSYYSISETNSHDDNVNYYSSGEDIDLLKDQYISDDILKDNSTKSTVLTGNDTELYYKNGTSYKVVLSDSEGSSLANQTVVFTINGNNYTRTTNANGTASIAINLIVGNYNISSYYAGTAGYGSASTSNLVKVLSTISGDDVEKYYKNDTQYYATFVDGQGNLLNNTTVTFNINGVFYERKTNENGTARLNINLQSGDYILTATNPVNGEMYSNDITVLTTIMASDVVKYYKNDTPYYATLLDNRGSPLINESVTFNINGVFYPRTTDSKGIAKLNINLNPNNYTITVVNPVNGEMHSNNIEVLPTISADDLTMQYKDGSKFVANAIDGQGNPLSNGTVTFNINGVLYNRTTNDDGNAYLNINLNVGSYIITTTNDKGLSISNNIIINKANSTIVSEDAHIILRIDREYSVKLMGLNNNTINSAPIQIKYANNTITAVTNETGEATILISNLSEGKYSIEFKFDGNGNYYPSTAKNTLIVANSTNILSGKDLNMFYKDGSRFNVTLTDLDGVPLPNETITLNINSRSYNRTTNSDGVVSLAINLYPGNYTVTYSYSDVDSEDYNKGSNTITVSKLPATLSAEDLALNFGDSAAFTATLTDASNSSLANIPVTFTINSVSYNRTTNKSGVAKLNLALQVGYYDITTSLDDLIYEAKSISNHILVNGTIITAEDLTMFAGSPGYFAVYLTDAYKNPISNAVIKFDYNGITKTAKTDSKGMAVATINELSKGDYLIVYNYTEGNKAGQANIHVIGTIPLSALVSAANTVNKYIEANAKLPSSVVIGDTTYSTAQYLYLLCMAITDISNKDYSDLYVFDVANPTNPGAAANMGTLSNFVSVAQSLLDSMTAGVTPNSVQTSIGNVGYDGIVYAFTRVIVYYGLMNSLPASVSVKSLKIYESKSVLDSKNTITDLTAYLASSTNCQVTNAAIVALANQLTSGLTNSYDKALAIYNYVRDYVSYSFYYDTRYGAAGTLKAKTGNCVDQAHLSIALYRAAGLPARYAHGTCVFSSGSTYGHVWAQVLLGNTWVVSDTTSTRNSFGKVVNWNNYNYSLKGYYSSIAF